jgi:hypothetical protein
MRHLERKLACRCWPPGGQFNTLAWAGLFDQVSQALGQGANANDTQLVGAVLWALWCLTLSMGALGMAYLGRAAWKLGRGSWWRGASTNK